MIRSVEKKISNLIRYDNSTDLLIVKSISDFVTLMDFQSDNPMIQTLEEDNDVFNYEI